MTKRMKAAERRACIVTVAKVLFADKGFHGVSVDEIARRVGVAPALLYQHFPSKEALYEEVISSLAGTRQSYIDAVLAGPDDFASVLERIVAVFVRSVAGDPDFLRMEMLSALEGSGAAHRFFESRWEAIAEFIEYSLRELASEEKVAQLNERTAALLFQGMLREALYVKCIVDSPRLKKIGLDDLVRQLLALFLRAVDYRGP